MHQQAAVVYNCVVVVVVCVLGLSILCLCVCMCVWCMYIWVLCWQRECQLVIGRYETDSFFLRGKRDDGHVCVWLCTGSPALLSKVVCGRREAGFCGPLLKTTSTTKIVYKSKQAVCFSRSMCVCVCAWWCGHDKVYCLSTWLAEIWVDDYLRFQQQEEEDCNSPNTYH